MRCGVLDRIELPRPIYFSSEKPAVFSSLENKEPTLKLRCSGRHRGIYKIRSMPFYIQFHKVAVAALLSSSLHLQNVPVLYADKTHQGIISLQNHRRRSTNYFCICSGGLLLFCGLIGAVE